MRIEVVELPGELRLIDLHDRTVVVLDVLRATTSMVTALAHGAKEIRIFDSLVAAKAVAIGRRLDIVLCGEERCRKPADFDLGNTPAEFTRERIAGKTLYMSTTNGTRAICAAVSAEEIFAAALVNATATAKMLARGGRDVTLLCAGTNGKRAIEDIVGAGAIIRSLQQHTPVELVENAEKSLRCFEEAKDSLSSFMQSGPGGRQLIDAGLQADIDFAAQLDVFDVVARVRLDPLRVEGEL